jgi:16S rRNA processing protein RimM
MELASNYIHLGGISGVFGVKGWVKIFSHTAPRENIVQYNVWQLQSGNDFQSIKVLNGRRQGKGIVARLDGIEYPDQARQLIGTDIFIFKDQLATLNHDEYYWSDLEGLAVVTVLGVNLGTIAWLFETGNNDVLVVKGDKERYIPFIAGDVVVNVDLQASTMIVDWDPEF